MSRDLRKYARQTNVQLVVGFFLILFIIGDGLIYLFLGEGAAVMGVICLLEGLLPALLIMIVLWAIDWFVRRNRAG